MLKKIYLLIAVYYSIKIGIEAGSINGFIIGLLYFAIPYVMVKFTFGYIKYRIQSSGGFLKFLLSPSTITTRYEKRIGNNVWNAMNPGSYRNSSYSQAYNEKRAADQRVFNRNKAMNEAAYHQYYANKNKGTYDGYRSQNKANNARNRASRY